MKLSDVRFVDDDNLVRARFYKDGVLVATSNYAPQIIYNEHKEELISFICFERDIDFRSDAECSYYRNVVVVDGYEIHLFMLAPMYVETQL